MGSFSPPERGVAPGERARGRHVLHPIIVDAVIERVITRWG